MAISNWMADLDGDLELCQIVMPGSHDAGMWTTTGSGISWNTHVITHDKDITGQLNAGCRFFDFRVFNYNATGKTKPKDLYFGHYAEKILFIGGRGNSLAGRFGAQVVPVFKAIKTWIENNDTEVVFLRFSHINSSNRSVVVQTVKDELGDVLLKTAKTHDTDNFAHNQLKEIKGHVVAIFDVGDGFTNDSLNGIMTYKSYKKVDFIPQCTKDIFLQLCGEYSNESTYSKMHPKQKARHKEHKKHIADNNSTHLHVIYFTFTSGVKNIKEMTKQYDNSFPTFLNEFVTHQATSHGCNIVMLDFINENKCQQVVEKGNGITFN
jgi:hypothetical protein